jgi:hypothetical protein
MIDGLRQALNLKGLTDEQVEKVMDYWQWMRAQEYYPLKLGVLELNNLAASWRELNNLRGIAV